METLSYLGKGRSPGSVRKSVCSGSRCVFQGLRGSTVPLSFFKAGVVLRTPAGGKPRSSGYQLGTQKKSGALHEVHFPAELAKETKQRGLGIRVGRVLRC